MEISPQEFSDLVQMEVKRQLEAIKADQAVKMSAWGRAGGLCRNPLKGFGTGDNARRAVAIRWAKYRALKQQA